MKSGMMSGGGGPRRARQPLGGVRPGGVGISTLAIEDVGDWERALKSNGLADIVDEMDADRACLGFAAPTGRRVMGSCCCPFVCVVVDLGCWEICTEDMMNETRARECVVRRIKRL